MPKIARWLALALCCAPGDESSAAVIAGLPNTPNALSQQLEAIYLQLMISGRIPVRTVKVEEQDNLERILRRERAFLGAYFPVLLDALSCDLNPRFCRRTLRKAGAAGQIVVSHPLELDLTPGDWNQIKVGDNVRIPHLYVERNVVTKQVVKRRGLSLDDMAQANEVCVGEQMTAEECRSNFELRNYANARFRDREYSDIINVPAYNYIVTIPPGCAFVCATIKSPISVDLARSAYVTAPFGWITSNREVARSKFDYGFAQEEIDLSEEVRPTSETIQQSTGPRENFSADVLRKLGPANQNALNGLWRAPAKIMKPFAAASEADKSFDMSEQKSVLQSTSYPLSGLDSLKSTIENGVTAQSVMIIDSAFDGKHCKLEKKIRIYDCRNLGKKFEDRCPLDVSEFTYDQAAAGSAALPSALPTAGSSAAKERTEAREKCGSAGQVTVENSPETESYITPRHGTHLAGIIGAEWNGFGSGGLNPFATIIGVRVEMERLTDEAYGRWLLRQVKKIIGAEKVRIVDFSAGYPLLPRPIANSQGASTEDWLTTLISDLKDFTVFVVAAGNRPDPSCTTIPACTVDRAKNVVTVVALDRQGVSTWGSSSTNPKFTLGAPGEKLIGTVPLNRFARLSGSSQAAALVAAALSLAMSTPSGALWHPAIARNRLIACSNVKNSALLTAMIGGTLDVSCLLAGEADQISTDGEPASGQVVGTLGSPQDLKLNFIDDDSGPDMLDVAKIVGFQRIDPASPDFIVFYSKNTDLTFGVIERRRGTFSQGQKLRFKVQQTIRPLPLEDVRKYVRHS